MQIVRKTSAAKHSPSRSRLVATMRGRSELLFGCLLVCALVFSTTLFVLGPSKYSYKAVYSVEVPREFNATVERKVRIGAGAYWTWGLRLVCFGRCAGSAECHVAHALPERATATTAPTTRGACPTLGNAWPAGGSCAPPRVRFWGPRLLAPGRQPARAPSPSPERHCPGRDGAEQEGNGGGADTGRR